MKKYYFRILLLMILLLLSYACKVNQSGSHNIPGAYNQKANFTEFQYIVYHISDSVSRLYFKMSTSGLLYSKGVGEENFRAKLSVHYNLYNIDEKNVISDSATLEYLDSANYSARYPIIDSADIKTSIPGKYLLLIKITDQNRKITSDIFITLNKENKISRQNFMLRDIQGNPVFKSYINSNDQIRIHSSRNFPTNLYVRYYSKEYPIALPPFIEPKDKSFSFIPDTIYKIQLSEGISDILNCNNPGIYHFQIDTMKTDGFTLFHFYDDFPNITSSKQMLPPLRYISTKTEYNDMQLMQNTKEAVDNFWLDKSGSPERAKEMIKRYYNRVVDANRFFTSYIEGWKTDRGIIYIVYGQPNTVYRSSESESWIYGEDRNFLSITFIFNKVENPFSDNDFILNKLPEYKDTWYNSVDFWRN